MVTPVLNTKNGLREHFGYRRLFRDETPDKAIVAFIGTTFPGRIGMSKVDIAAGWA